MKAGLRTALSLLIFTISLIVFLLINPGNRGHENAIIIQGGKATGQAIGFGTNVLQAKESGRIETSILTVSDRPTIVLLRIFLSTNVIEAIKPGFYSTSPETIQIERRNIPGTTNAIYNFVIGFRDGSNEIEIATLQKAK